MDLRYIFTGRLKFKDGIIHANNKSGFKGIVLRFKIQLNVRKAIKLLKKGEPFCFTVPKLGE